MNKKIFTILRCIASLGGAILFATFCSLQFNDTSQFEKYGSSQSTTILWILGYGLMAGVCLTHFFITLPRCLTLFIAALSFILAAARATGIDWSQPLLCITSPPGSTTYHPAGNETGGLLIVAIWMLFLYSTGESYKASTSETPLRPGNTDKSI